MLFPGRHTSWPPPLQPPEGTGHVSGTQLSGTERTHHSCKSPTVDGSSAQPSQRVDSESVAYPQQPQTNEEQGGVFRRCIVRSRVSTKTGIRNLVEAPLEPVENWDPQRPGCPTQVRDPLQQNGSQVIGWAGSHESLGSSHQTNPSWHPVPGSMVS